MWRYLLPMVVGCTAHPGNSGSCVDHHYSLVDLGVGDEARRETEEAFRVWQRRIPWTLEPEGGCPIRLSPGLGPSAFFAEALGEGGDDQRLVRGFITLYPRFYAAPKDVRARVLRHEFGHLLGLEHAPRGIMVFDPYQGQDMTNEDYENACRIWRCP